MSDEQRHLTVDVWLLGLDRDPEFVERYRGVLSPDELERASRLRSFNLRADFIYTRGALRHILSDHAGVAPSEIRFTYEDRGKPHLITSHGGDGIGFNVSHSRDISVFAIAHGRPVGIDVEQIRNDYDHDPIAERWFSSRENELLGQLPEKDQTAGFFAVWSRKEALVKALGTGISHRLSSFSVSVSPTQPAAILETAWDPSQIDAWSIHDIPLPQGYSGAVVAAGQDWSPVFRAWSHP